MCKHVGTGVGIVMILFSPYKFTSFYFHIARRSQSLILLRLHFPTLWTSKRYLWAAGLYYAMHPVAYLLHAAGGWQELNQRKNQTKYRDFLFLFFAGYSFLFPSLSPSPTILKESGKHYFVIRGPFSPHTCCMTSQPNGIQVLLNNIVKFKLQPNCNVETLSIYTGRDNGMISTSVSRPKSARFKCIIFHRLSSLNVLWHFRSFQR